MFCTLKSVLSLKVSSMDKRRKAASTARSVGMLVKSEMTSNDTKDSPSTSSWVAMKSAKFWSYEMQVKKYQPKRWDKC